MERLLKDARRVLEHHFWIPEVQTKTAYERLHDDHDGTRMGTVVVHFLENGDAILDMRRSHEARALRFRAALGGGESLRVHNALMLLAYAIKLDNEKCPQGD
jgi:hypothetical protein